MTTVELQNAIDQWKLEQLTTEQAIGRLFKLIYGLNTDLAEAQSQIQQLKAASRKENGSGLPVTRTVRRHSFRNE